MRRNKQDLTQGEIFNFIPTPSQNTPREGVGIYYLWQNTSQFCCKAGYLIVFKDYQQNFHDRRSFVDNRSVRRSSLTGLFF